MAALLDCKDKEGGFVFQHDAMTRSSQPLCPNAFNTVKVISQALYCFQQLQTPIVCIVTDDAGSISSNLLRLPFSVAAWITSNNHGLRAIGPLNYSAYCQGCGKEYGSDGHRISTRYRQST